MKFNPYMKDLSKRYANNKTSKPNLNNTYTSLSRSKNHGLKLTDDASPGRPYEQYKHSLSNNKLREPTYRSSHDQQLNTTKRKSYVSKTPKNNSNTWLVRQQLKLNGDLEKAAKSKIKIEEKHKAYLENSISPKTYENAFTFAEKQYNSSKASNRYKSFGRQPNGTANTNQQSDLKQTSQQKNKSAVKEPLKIRTDYDVRAVSPLNRRSYRAVDENQPKRHQPSYQDLENLRKRNELLRQEELRKKEERIQANQNYNCQFQLTEEQYKNFGDRFPSNFVKVGLLGRGGFSLVWLGIQRKTKKKLAIKQILTKNPHQTHLKQIWFGSYYFNSGGEPRQEFANHPGINNICRLLAYDIKPQDTWLFYELCQESLGNSLYELKGETVNDQRMYKIFYKPLYSKIRQNQNQLKFLIVEVCKALMLMNTHNIVHSDLKTENILLRFKRREDDIEGSGFIKSVKIIDFGSSFLFTNLKQFSMATPEYMPPQILNYILFQNELEYDEELLLKIQKYKKPWVVDIWSLGCIVLQIVCGVPLWMSLKTKIQYKGEVYASGIFAVKGRLFPKIISKQIQAVKKLDYHLDNDNHSGIQISKEIRVVLKKMLQLDPEERISPRQVLEYFKIDCEPDRFPFY